MFTVCSHFDVQFTYYYYYYYYYHYYCSCYIIISITSIMRKLRLAHRSLGRRDYGQFSNLYLDVILYLVGNLYVMFILLVVVVVVVVRSVFKCSCLFLRPRPWQFEI